MTVSHTSFFVFKRVFLYSCILVAAGTGILLPTRAAGTSTTQQSYAAVVTPVDVLPSVKPPVVNQDLPRRKFAVSAQEVYQSIVPTPAATAAPTMPWGQARQIDEHTWTIDVKHDDHMTSAQEIFSALNVYRKQRGKGELSWDSRLASFAEGRANGFNEKGDLDAHAGFQDYIHNQDGFNKLGFFALGENSSIGYTLNGTHLIEWVYAGDKPHDDNQLSDQWTHVGIGVAGDATNLVFGGKKQ